MDKQQARDDLASAQHYLAAAGRPKLAGWQPPVCGVLTAAGLSALGLLPYTIWWRILAVAIAVVCLGGAALLVQVTRTRQGIKGVRGAARTERTAVVICALAVFVGAVEAAPGMRWIYTGLGVFAGTFSWAVLRRQVR